MSTGTVRTNQAGAAAATNADQAAAADVANGAMANRPSNLGFNRDAIIELYEKKLRKARSCARLMGFLNAFSQFLAFCNLTWATVALLGAFLPDLYSRDFAFVTALIFVEATRLASVSFFMRLLMRPLSYSSQDPKRMHHGVDGQYPLSLRARLCSNVVQLIFIVPSSAIPIVALLLQDYRSSTTGNLQVSLQIFYYMVAINSVVALVYLFCSLGASICLRDSTEQSVLRYFDTVLERAMNSGLVQADDFELFRFAYTMLGNEFRRNVQPEAVAKNHKELIQYMYAHRLGVDFLEIYLDADCAFVRLAAVNMVGFWADGQWGVGVSELVKLPEEILTKLADKVSLGQVGWAAANSFGVLASTLTGALLVARTSTSKNGTGVAARLAYVVDETSSRSLSLVRSLVRFYEQICCKYEQEQQSNEQELEPPMPFGGERDRLVLKLEKLARDAKRHRLRVQAAYLLLLMREAPKRDEIEAIDPREDQYWFESEVRMLEYLRGHCDLEPLVITHRDCNFIRPDAYPVTPPRWVNCGRSAVTIISTHQVVISSRCCNGAFPCAYLFCNLLWEI